MLRSFRAALIGFILAAALLPVLAVSVPFVLHIYSITREGAVRELRLIAERQAAEVSHELNFAATRFADIGNNKDLVLAAASPFFRSRATAIAEEYLQQTPLAEATFLLNATNEVVDAVPENPTEPDLRRLTQAIHKAIPVPSQLRGSPLMLWFEDPQLLKHIRHNHPAASDDPRMVVLAMPLFVDQYLANDAKQMKGILISVIPADRVSALATSHLGSQQSLRVLTIQDASLIQGSRNEQQAEARVVVGAGASKFEFLVRVSEPNRVRFAGVHRTVYLLCFFLVLASAVFALVAYLLARRLGHPLRQLENTASNYAAGHYQAATGPTKFSEFRRVSDTLANMGQRIAQQLEEVRNANTQLRLADKLKDDFLACTSHELRTPLHGIVGIASSLLDGAAGELSPKIHNNLLLITQSGKRLEKLVNDILDFSRIRNQALSLSLKPVDLYSLVDIVLSLHTVEAEQGGLSLRNAVPRELPLAWADEYRLQQVLHNLVGNAIKFTPQGLVTVRGSVDGALLRLAVEDTGIGIPPEKQASIFEPFVQVENSLTRTHAGTGLGLSISRQLVELQGGTLGVSSVPAQGTCFFFTLPIAADQKLEPVTAKPTIPPPQSDSQTRPPATDTNETAPSLKPDLPELPGLPHHAARILLVDDEPINLEILGNYFFSEPYTLYRASSGAQALEVLETTNGIDLILLDVMMPKMSGFEVCRRIRADSRHSHISIIFLTARDQASDIHQGFSLGANDYLIKPVSRMELLTRVQYHIHFGRVKSELASLNMTLELNVAARTAELENTLSVIQRNNDIFRALLEISIELQNRDDLTDGLHQTLAKLSALYPQRGFCIILKPSRENEKPLIFTHLQPELERVVNAHNANEADDRTWLAEHDLVALPLWGPRQKQLGELLVWPSRLDQTELEIVEITSRQLASVVENRRLTDVLERLAVTDPLTGAYNRHFFEKSFATQCYRYGRNPNQHFGLISIDINGLKHTNDQYGHEAGDALIKRAVELISLHLRQTDVMCRVGGDELVIIAEAAGIAACNTLVERLSRAQRNAHCLVPRTNGERISLPLHYAIGAATTEETAPNELLRLADQRMYADKQAYYAAFPQAPHGNRGHTA